MNSIHWVPNHLPPTPDKRCELMAPHQIQKATAFHETIPGYAPTPLVSLPHMAKHLGLSHLSIKDESYRFGLNAFKVLGASYAIARYIAQKIPLPDTSLSYELLTSHAVRDHLGPVTFFTATDGNHGRGVAWAAHRLGQTSVVLMPKGSSPTRLAHILSEGATATIEEGNYDECVRMAAAMSKETPNSVVIQDTAWEGYEEIPTWIMQGYGTMVAEAVHQWAATNPLPPTHVFVQAGVGSLAGAVTGYLHQYYAPAPPAVYVVEAQAAACLYETAKAADDSLHMISGDLSTIMAGLACGEPNPISWDILQNHSAGFFGVDDTIAANGMRLLGAPCKGDTSVISGESGAAPMGLLAALMTDPHYQSIREAMCLDASSRVLLFSTEGDTDPARYQEIVWKGAYHA